jgi:SsrA-binding protein
MRVINKDAYRNHQVLEEFEAGLVLRGAETKSAKSGAVSLKGARATFRGDELWLVGMQINPYQFAPSDLFEPTRSRKLLLSRSQLEEIRGKMSQKGLTLVPLECYTKGSWIKVKLGLVRGRRIFEKRELLKKRTEQRKIQERLKERYRV